MNLYRIFINVVKFVTVYLYVYMWESSMFSYIKNQMVSVHVNAFHATKISNKNVAGAAILSLDPLFRRARMFIAEPDAETMLGILQRIRENWIRRCWRMFRDSRWIFLAYMYIMGFLFQSTIRKLKYQRDLVL